MKPSEVLWTSAANLVRADREIAALRLSLEEGFARMRSVHECRKANVSGSLRSEPNYWVDTYWYEVYLLHRKPTRGPAPFLGTLTVAYSLWREDEVEGSWHGAQESKLYVGFDPKKLTAESYWSNEDLCLNGTGRPIIESVAAVAPCLWEYNPQPAELPFSMRSWFFGVPLDTINSVDDLSREIIEPADRLLEGRTPNEAFADARDVYKVRE